MNTLIFRVIPVLLLGLWLDGVGLAQSPPDNVAFSPSTVMQGECTSVVVEGGAWMTVDLLVLDPGWGETVMYWINLNGSGRDSFCINPYQAPGTYVVIGIRNSDSDDWSPVWSSFDVVGRPPAGANLTQPTGLSIDPGWGYAGVSSGYGNSCMTMTFAGGANTAGGANMTIDALVTLSSNPGSLFDWGPHALDANGQMSSCAGHYSYPQTFSVYAIRNFDFDYWIWLPEPVQWTLLPPQPTSLSFNTPMVHPGGAYEWIVGNGEDATLDVKVTRNNEPLWTGYAMFRGDSSGIARVQLPVDQPLGRYHVTSIRNTSNPDWVGVDATIDVCSYATPVVTAVSPAGMALGGSGIVTIYGTNLCNINGVVFSPSGFLTLDDIGYSTDGSSITARVSVPFNAPYGTRTITLLTGNGNAQFLFDIKPLPTISGISVPQSEPGSTVVVTLYGDNLAGASLSTSWNGLSFYSISSNATSVTATYAIAPGATAGSPAIVVTTSTGSTTTQLFSITGLRLSREFIYLGDRILAVDQP